MPFKNHIHALKEFEEELAKVNEKKPENPEIGFWSKDKKRMYDFDYDPIDSRMHILITENKEKSHTWRTIRNKYFNKDMEPIYKGLKKDIGTQHIATLKKWAKDS
jgi:hypothetical protein